MHRLEKNILHHANKRREQRQLKNKIMNEFILVEFPQSQKYMNCDWFEEEAYFCIELDSAYFIPKHRINN